MDYRAGKGIKLKLMKDGILIGKILTAIGITIILFSLLWIFLTLSCASVKPKFSIPLGPRDPDCGVFCKPNCSELLQEAVVKYKDCEHEACNIILHDIRGIVECMYLREKTEIEYSTLLRQAIEEINKQ